MSSFKKRIKSQNRDKFSKNKKKKLTTLNNKKSLFVGRKLKGEGGRVGGKVRDLGSTKK